MTAKGNDQLTIELNQLTNRVQGLADKLESMMPEVRDKIVACETTTSEMSSRLQELVNPILQADLINKNKIISDQMNIINGLLAEANTTMAQHRQSLEEARTKVESFDSVKTVVGGLDVSVKNLQAEALRVANESMTTKTESDRQYSEMQQQIIVVSSQSANSSGIASGGRSNEPFVTHKLIMGKDKISGDEEFTVIDGWINELYTDLEIIMPGAKAIMKESEVHKQVIDEPALMRHANSAMATKLSRELYVILSKKTTPNSKARFKLNGLTENQGLEALRRIRLNLCKREGPRLQDEYEASTTLPKIKESDMSNLQTLLRRWESEIEKFEALDPGYALGIFQRRNMVYRALSESCQKEIDNEVGKGELTNYEGFMDFVINMSRHARYKKQSAPKPLTANLVSEDQGRSPNSLGSEPIYSVDEWVESQWGLLHEVESGRAQ